MNKTITTIFTCLLGAASVFATQPSSNLTAEQALQKNDKQFFIENKGQWDSDVLFLTRMGGLDVWITKYGVNYTFYQIEKNSNAKKAERLPSKFENDWEDATLLGHRVLLKLQNHQPNPKAEGKIKQTGYYNYLIGNDPSKHASNVGLYKEALVKNVYNGIDLRYYFDNGYLRYDFVVQPGADPSQIKFELDGEFKEYLKNNTLCYTTRFGEVQMQDLYVYQQNDKKQVQAKFTQQNGAWQFQLSNYDKTQPLIIDPLVYSTYIGGSGEDYGYDIAIDGSGNAYITGYTTSNDYDITPGVFRITIGGLVDVFVTKLNSTGTGLVYSTYIGGSNSDYGNAIAIDASGNAYITGYTSSSDYDITPGAFQTIIEGDREVFVSKLNSTGTGLIYSTYIGGSSEDFGYDIAIDGSDNAYVTGTTFSSDYDTTPGAFQTTNGGNWDVFVTKLNSTGNTLIYSTYIGGISIDECRAIAIDGSGNAYITGWTGSSNYDITAGAFQTTNGGFYDVFVTKLNSTGTGLIYSTYIGGSGLDEGYDIAIDGSGNAYITGNTESTNYDITPGAFQTTNGGGKDVFVSKLNSTGTGLIYSTYIGGINLDRGQAIAIDGSGNAYVTGYTNSSDYDITSGAFQTTKVGTDVFVTKLSLCALPPSQPGFISGNINVCAGSSQTYSVPADPDATSYTWTLPSGWTGSSTTNSISATVGANSGNITVTANNACGSSTAQTLAITVNTVPSQPGAISGTTNVCEATTQTYSVAAVPGASSYTWTLPSGWTGSSTSDTIQVSAGSNGGTITVIANNGCGSSTAQTINITVNPLPNVSANASATAVCAGGQVTLTGSGANTYTWSGGVSDGVAFTPSSTATYTVTGTDANGCSNTAQITITVNSLPNVTVSNNANTLTANQAGATYQWIDCNNNNAPISGANNQSFTPTTDGSYAVVVTLNGCVDTSACQTITITGLDTQASSKLPFSIYPNPNRGNFTIQGTKGGVFELIDVTGKVIHTYIITNTQQTVNENIPAGMYFVREKESGRIQKLVVQ
jgi:hypothetical protein